MHNGYPSELLLIRSLTNYKSSPWQDHGELQVEYAPEGFRLLGYHFTVKKQMQCSTGFMSNRKRKEPPPERWLFVLEHDATRCNSMEHSIIFTASLL